MTGEAPEVRPDKRKQREDRQNHRYHGPQRQIGKRRERERKKRNREKRRKTERKRCPGSIIINLHSILKKKN